MLLTELIYKQSIERPDAIAVSASDGELTYGELNSRSNQIARALIDLGIRKGDRVGIWLEKSCETICVMQGVMLIGAAYIPLDPMSPIHRIRFLIEDCGIAVLVSSSASAASLLIDGLATVAHLSIDISESGTSSTQVDRQSTTPIDSPYMEPSDLAYILYTSGSTGSPKGVAISHQNSLAFVQWAHETIGIVPEDRLANHAPFHFDLSVFDIYAAFSAGASVHLIPSGAAFAAEALVNFIMERKISIWYSVPTVLTMMMDDGELLQKRDIPVNVFIFAGEPFPIEQLRRLFNRRPYPQARYLNFYGPTETNVCTYHEIVSIDELCKRRVPIGIAASGNDVWAETSEGRRAGVGDEGELIIQGPTVYLGYWGKSVHGDKPYRTGDRVCLNEKGGFEFLGRKDQMVKIRGNRVELSEIEIVLEQHLSVSEVAVVVSGDGIAARLVAFIVVVLGHEDLCLLEVKRHCAERLPKYMIVDRIILLDTMARNRNGKIDRRWLTEHADV